MKNYLATEQQGIEILYRGNSLSDIPFSDITNYNKFCDELELVPLSDKTYFSQDFNIPQHYKELDVEEFVYSKLEGRDSAEAVKARVEMELAMYKERGLFPILQLLVYIVDTMRKHNLVWGVGRGSSVSSYVLYILGVHKVDSYKYNLDIKEFLK